MGDTVASLELEGKGILPMTFQPGGLHGADIRL
jgi:hypothetical protein